MKSAPSWWFCVMVWMAGAGLAVAQPINVEWFEAARMGNTEFLKRQLAAGANINQEDFSKETALNHALAGLQFETAKFLIEKGADLSKPADYRMPLNWAVQAGNLDVVRLMLAKGADMRVVSDTATGRRISLLNDTVQWGRVDMLKLFESKGYGAAPEFYSDMAAWAVMHGEVEAMTYYLGKGANANARYRDNLPLDVAAHYGDMPAVEALLKAGARPNLFSEGSPRLKNWNAFKRTPLISAIISDEREVVARLLKAGADANALNGEASVWADLVGDEEIYRMLKRAGARDPAPFEFADWLGAGYEYPYATAERKRASAGEATVAELARLGELGRGPSDSSRSLPAGTKIAIVMVGSGLADAEALLTAKATALPGAVVLERSEIRRIVAERTLTEMLARPRGESEAGRLLGADVLVVLRTRMFEKTKVREARVVATRTGVVAGVAYAPESISLESWTTEALGHCLTAGEVLQPGAGDIQLVAIPRVVASMNTPETRELERRITLVLAARIGRLPNVFLVERESIDRLTLEQGAEGAAFASSTWIMDAALDVPLGTGGEYKLTVSMRPGAKGSAVKLESVAARTPDTSGLTDDMMVKIGAVFGSSERTAWTQATEAGEFLAKAKWYAGTYLWAEAGAAAETAWALGLRTDEVARRRLQAATMRLLHMQRVIIPQKRRLKNYYGVAEFLSHRAPLLMLAEDGALSLDEQLDLANLALDVYEASLPGLGGAFAGVPGSQWLCGDVWEAATLPLRWMEPLSYRRTHGAELASLRARLMALHAEALMAARKRRSALEVHSLTGIGLKHLAWWQPEEAEFRRSVRQTLREAAAWQAPLSEHAAWTIAWDVARTYMGPSAGRAGRAWARLARELSSSADPREAFLGLVLVGLETNSLRRRVEIMETLKERFARVSDLDRGINTEVYEVARARVSTSSLDLFLRTDCDPWYYEALKDLRHEMSAKLLTIKVGMPRDSTSAITGQDRVYPEIRAFNIAQGQRRLEMIRRVGAGGVLHFYMNEKHGYNGAEIAEMRTLRKGVEPVFAQLAERVPQTAYAHKKLVMFTNLAGWSEKDYGTGVSIDSGKPNNPFLALYEGLRPELRRTWRLSEKFDRVGVGSDGWHFVHIGAGREADADRVSDLWMFRVAPSGALADMRKLDVKFSLTYSGIGQLQPQISQLWMVIPGVRWPQRVEYQNRVEEIAVFDARDFSVPPRYFRLASSRGGMRSLRLSGDRVVYSFVHNPTGQASGMYEFEKKGDATFGIAEIDLKTGQETLLASSRRQPAIAPVEGEKFRLFRSLWLIGESAFTVSDQAKRSNFAFDFNSREWRSLTDDDKKAVAEDARMRPTAWWIQADGAWLTLERATRENNLRFKGVKGIGAVDIAVNFDYDGIEEAYQGWEAIIESTARLKREGHKPIYPSKHGLIITLNNGVYYWLPMDQLRAKLTEAVAAKRKAGSVAEKTDSESEGE